MSIHTSNLMCLFCELTWQSVGSFRSTDVGASKVTFDDLLESLKQLEEEPEDLLKAPAGKDNIYGGWGEFIVVPVYIQSR